MTRNDRKSYGNRIALRTEPGKTTKKKGNGGSLEKGIPQLRDSSEECDRLSTPLARRQKARDRPGVAAQSASFFFLHRPANWFVMIWSTLTSSGPPFSPIQPKHEREKQMKKNRTKISSPPLASHSNFSFSLFFSSQRQWPVKETFEKDRKAQCSAHNGGDHFHNTRFVLVDSTWALQSRLHYPRATLHYFRQHRTQTSRFSMSLKWIPFFQSSGYIFADKDLTEKDIKTSLMLLLIYSLEPS